MPRLAIGSIEKKILDGIGQAERDYLVWSNGDYLEYAPEYFITTWIGRKIRGIQSHELWISFEHNIDHTLREAKGKKRGRPSGKLQLTGRYDIVVWRKKQYTSMCNRS